MLAVPMKESKGLDWSGPLRTYLQNNYTAEELDKHANSIQRLSTTRERVANASGASGSSVDAMESYLTMLGDVEPRFPLGEGGLKLTFTWYDALKPTKKLSMTDVAYERASVLFNLGAVLSHQGMVQDRSDISGLKKACMFFQRAAGVFMHLRDNVVGEQLRGPTLTDLSPEGLDMLYNLMLAQAQACFYEKAIRDKHKPAILSKLAAKATELYERAWRCSQSSVLAPTLDKAWPAHLEFQFRCFQASAQFQYSKFMHAKAEETTEGYGEELARLALSSDMCEAAIQCAKAHQLPASMLDTVVHLRQVIHKNIDEASEANNKIYMELIPNKSTLSTPPGTALAKPIAPAPELVEPASVVSAGNEEEHIFTGLLPVSMQEAEATYQSRLSGLVETSGKKVQDACEEIKLRLAEAGLPAAVEAGDGSNGLPDAVWERLNSSVIARGGIDALRRGIHSNEDLAAKVESSLAEIESKLAEEEAEDTRCRSTWGSQWTASLSMELSMHMRSDCARYRELVAEARASDQVLRDKLTASQNKLEILKYSKSRLNELFPSSEDVDSNPEVEATREELALMLVNLGANVQEIEALQAQLVDDVAKDSIAPAMARAPGGARAVAASESRTKELMDQQMAKYRPLLDSIDKQIREQPMLLSRVLDKNHNFSQMRNQSEGMLKREGLIAEIDQAILCYEEIIMFIAEGEKFYINLSGRIEQLRVTAMDHCYVREMQRKELEASLTAQQRQAERQAATAATAASNVSTATVTSAYPGMARPGMDRMNSQPFMQPYAAGVTPAPAYPMPIVDAQPAAAYPVNNGGGAAPPPPAYSQAVGNGASSAATNAKVRAMKETLGSAYSDAALQQALDGAGGDVNIAINHLLGAGEPPSPTDQGGKRKSKKRFGGLFSK